MIIIFFLHRLEFKFKITKATVENMDSFLTDNLNMTKSSYYVSKVEKYGINVLTKMKSDFILKNVMIIFGHDALTDKKRVSLIFLQWLL